ncbi:flagellin [Methylobacterium sp. WCS2018Hpa-22]|uniref:flagellin N-terminal helical domain-containing protein n=1 Tax=Methylobacterium sp. WCS2018Hpa-22 TaxID=3073633 RepID=UPI00288B1376|nr:flagellin [Methylobacterium sp. WCS2018Hpa-22]
MSGSITLTSATRQNLLSLQDTANLLSTTQNRLSTGKKVNSALDNPTNFFTAQSLSARSSDISSLLDGISNGVQAIQAASQGITSITKLLETAKSTASQALADKTGGSSGISGGATEQAAKVTGTSTLASLGTTDATGETTFDFSGPTKDASLEITLGGTKSTIRIDSATLASSGTDLSKITSDQLLTAINGQIANNSALAGKVTAGTSPDGRITFATTTTGASASLTVAGSANSTMDIGYGKSTTTPTSATVTANAALAVATDFSTGSASLVVSDGNTSVQVQLDKNSATDELGGTLGASASREDVAKAINKQLKDSGSTATVELSSTNSLVFKSADVGPDAQISVIGGIDTTGGNSAAGIGFSTFTASTPVASSPAAADSTDSTDSTAVAAQTLTTGTASVKGAVASTTAVPETSDLGAGQSTTFSVTDAVANKTINITINKDSLDANGAALGTTGITDDKILEAVKRQLTAAGSGIVATLSGGTEGALKFENAAVGAGSDPVLTTQGNNLTDQIGLFSAPSTTVAGTIAANTDLTEGKSATFTVTDGTTPKTITIDAAKLDASGTAIGTNPNQQSLVEAINNQLSGSEYSAYIDSSNKLTFVGPNDTAAAPQITNASDTIGLGLGTANTLTATNEATTPSASTAAKVTATGTAVSGASGDLFALTTTANTFSISDGTKTANISIASDTPSGSSTLGEDPTQDEIKAAIQAQLDEAGVNVTAAFNANKLEFTSKGVGTSGTVTLTRGVDGTGAAGLGIGSAVAGEEPVTATGIPAGSIDLSGGKSSAFTIGDGTSTKAVTVSSTSLDKDGNAIGEAATQDKVAEAIQVQLDTGGIKATVSFVDDKLQVKSNAVGTGAAAPTLTATSDTAGLGLGTTTTASSTPAAGGGTAAAGVTASGTEATDGSSKASIVGTEQTVTKDFSGTKDASFTLKLGTGPLKLITLNNTNLGTSAATSQTAIAKAINDQINADTGLAGKVEASYVNSKLVISTKSSGSDQKLTIQAAQVTTGGTAGVDIGFGVSGSGATSQTASGTDVGGSKGTSSVRSALAQQFNLILEKITQQAQDSGYNGVNLLFRNSNSAADNTLHIAFNEKNTSALDIQGVKFDAAGLGLDAVEGGFQSDTDINAAIEQLSEATTQLRTQSSTFGANLSIVQNRQDFSKNLINILDTGAANLVNADLNEEAANSQALSTRNSIATSALSLANTAQQGILQLLR